MADEPSGAAKAVTKIRIQVPRGAKVEDLLSGLQISFEPAKDSAAQINTNYCCVDVAVVGPFSTIANNGGGGDDGGVA